MRYRGTFLLFTSPDIDNVQRQKMIQGMLLKHKMESRKPGDEDYITDNECNGLVGDLMGGSPEERLKLINALKEINEKERNAKIAARDAARGKSERNGKK